MDEPDQLPPRPFGGVDLEFPISYDLRIIYILSGGATIEVDLERIFGELGVKCALMQGMAAPGARYGRWGSRITLESREQMYAMYERIRELPYIKAAI